MTSPATILQPLLTAGQVAKKERPRRPRRRHPRPVYRVIVEDTPTSEEAARALLKFLADWLV